MSPTVRQHLDTGGVRVEVTGISNGSVVVEFNLLIVTDLAVQEVSAAFRSAFEHASLLEVAGGDIFIGGTWTPGLAEARWVWNERQREPSCCLRFRKTSGFPALDENRTLYCYYVVFI